MGLGTDGDRPEEPLLRKALASPRAGPSGAARERNLRGFADGSALRDVTRGKVELRWQPAYSRGEKALLECKTSPSTFTNRWLGITEHTGVLTLAREISARSFGRSPELDKSPGSLSERPSRTYVERKTLASGIFSGIHVNHLYGLWLGSRNERIVVQQQSRLDYPHKLAARHRFRHRDRNGQGIRGKVAIHDQGVARQLFVLLKDRVNARIDRLK